MLLKHLVYRQYSTKAKTHVHNELRRRLLQHMVHSFLFVCIVRYMKYLYLYECEKKSLSSPAELQAAIDGNRREGRRPSYGTTSFNYSPTPAGPNALLGGQKLSVPMLGVHPTSRMSPVNPLKKGQCFHDG